MPKICAICIGTEEGGDVVAPPCGHVFHRPCIETYIREALHPNCPECRKPFKARGLKQLFFTLGSSSPARPSSPIAVVDVTDSNATAGTSNAEPRENLVQRATELLHRFTTAPNNYDNACALAKNADTFVESVKHILKEELSNEVKALLHLIGRMLQYMIAHFTAALDEMDALRDENSDLRDTVLQLNQKVLMNRDEHHKQTAALAFLKDKSVRELQQQLKASREEETKIRKLYTQFVDEDKVKEARLEQLQKNLEVSQSKLQEEQLHYTGLLQKQQKMNAEKVSRLEEEKEALEQKLMSRIVNEADPTLAFMTPVYPSTHESEEPEPEEAAPPSTFQPNKDMFWKERTKRTNNLAPPTSQLRKIPRLEKPHPIVSEWAKKPSNIIVGTRKKGLN